MHQFDREKAYWCLAVQIMVSDAPLGMICLILCFEWRTFHCFHLSLFHSFLSNRSLILPNLSRTPPLLQNYIQPCAKERVKNLSSGRNATAFAARLWMTVGSCISASSPWHWLLCNTWHLIDSGDDGSTCLRKERGKYDAWKKCSNIFCNVFCA